MIDGGSIVTGAIGAGISSLLGFGSSAASSSLNYKQQSALMGQQFNYQKQLNALQQQYARENADVQYDRQRQFTSDSWLLNRQGMQNAGLNPAWMNGSSNPTASVDAAAAPNAGAAPSGNISPLDFSGSVNNFLSTMINGANVLSEKKLRDAQAEQIQTDLMTRAQENIARLRSLKATASSDEAKAAYDKALNDLRIQYDKMNIRNQAMILDNDRSNSDITAQLFGENAQNQLALLRNNVAIAAEQHRLSKKEADNYLRMLDARILNLRAGSALSYAQAAVAPTQAAVNNATVDKLNAEAHTLDVDSLPTTLLGLLARSKQGRSVLNKLENGIKLNDSDAKYLKALNYQNATEKQNWWQLLQSAFN